LKKNGLLQCTITDILKGNMVKIKKYANRRLYNVNQSCYITLDELADLVRAGHDIEVRDAKTNQDLTRPTLVQIILDHEGEGHQMLPVAVLCQIISAYGTSIEPLLSRYLERTMASFTRLHPLASQALEKTLDAISENQEISDTPPESPLRQVDDNRALIGELRTELDALKDRLKSIET